MNTDTILIYILLIVPVLLSLSYFGNLSQIIGKIGSILEAIIAFIALTIPLGEYSYFNINSVNRILIISVSIVYTFSVFFASTYHRGIKEPRHLKLHYSLMHLFVFTMLFTLAINDFGLMWIGIEATTASSALLLIIERQKTEIEAAWRYVLIVSTGLTLALISVILIYLDYHTLNSVSIINAGHSPSFILTVAGATALVGFGTKIGIFPMHTWLPDAHGEAPSEISAMFSGILLPVAAYVLYRFYLATYSGRLEIIFMIFILATLVFVALIMPSQKNIKRMFAYSTMENMALITLGLITGGLALVGALLIILTHAFGKSGAFFSSGNILKIYGTKKIDSIRGLRNKSPSTAMSLLASSLAVTGAPPFTAFVGELLIIYQLISNGSLLAVFITVVCIFIISISLMQKVTVMIFDGNTDKDEVAGLDKTQKYVAGLSVLFAFSIIFVYLGGFI
ncbi:MAG: hydrogenase 4 subunit F [Candidatus Thermoplasmatota archaeon]|nr:hydrogenase 4 subunit F [Candidatus Thermoplasmatota archaeon]